MHSICLFSQSTMLYLDFKHIIKFLDKVSNELWTSVCVRRGSHQGGSPQNRLRDERTCGTTLASAYMLRHLSAAWSQLQMKEESPSGSEY